MPFPRLLAIAAFATFPLTGVAAQNNEMLDASDAAAEVVVAPYESAFEGYRSWQDIKLSPALGWRAANDEMARVGGHAGQIKDMPDEALSATQKPVPMDAQAPTKSGAQAPAQATLPTTPAPVPPKHDMKNMKEGK